MKQMRFNVFVVVVVALLRQWGGMLRNIELN
jgi:hypothetical protein